MEAIPGKKDQLVEVLESLLVGGRFAAGDRFLSTYDIAREYGVSPGTARHALRELVAREYLDASHRSGYFVRESVESLAVEGGDLSVSVPTVLLVIVGPIAKRGRRVQGEYLAALEEVCAWHGWEAVIVKNNAADIANAVRGKRLAGCMVYALKEPPAVQLDRGSTICWGPCGDWVEPDCSVVAVDTESAALLAYEHLWDLGHERTALVWSEDSRFASARIVLGMRKAYAALGHVWSPNDVIQVGDDEASSLYERLCAAGITGVVCEHWDFVLELYRQAHQAGEQIGERLSVVAIGGHDMVDLLRPAPARTRWRAVDHASLIVDALRNRLEGKPTPRRLILPVFLQEGGSARSPLTGRLEDLEPRPR